MAAAELATTASMSSTVNATWRMSGLYRPRVPVAAPARRGVNTSCSVSGVADGLVGTCRSLV